MSVIFLLIDNLPKTAHMVKKPMATSKEGMRTLIRYALLDLVLPSSETKIKSTFQWEGDNSL